MPVPAQLRDYHELCQIILIQGRHLILNLTQSALRFLRQTLEGDDLDSLSDSMTDCLPR